MTPAMSTRFKQRLRAGSLVNHKYLTAAMIDGRDFIAGCRKSDTELMLPKGTEKAAACWADHRKVTQIGFKPDWTRDGKAAPLKRNDRVLDIVPVGVIVFPGPATLSTRPQSSAFKFSTIGRAARKRRFCGLERTAAYPCVAITRPKVKLIPHSPST
jgi:hypothetical protein